MRSRRSSIAVTLPVVSPSLAASWLGSMGLLLEQDLQAGWSGSPKATATAASKSQTGRLEGLAFHAQLATEIPSAGSTVNPMGGMSP